MDKTLLHKAYMHIEVYCAIKLKSFHYWKLQVRRLNKHKKAHIMNEQLIGNILVRQR